MSQFWDETPSRDGPVLLTDTAQTITTGPTNTAHRLVLREISICNETGDIVAVTMGLATTGAAGDLAGKRMLNARELPKGETLMWDFEVLEGAATAQTLYALCTPTNGATIIVPKILMVPVP